MGLLPQPVNMNGAMAYAASSVKLVLPAFLSRSRRVSVSGCEAIFFCFNVVLLSMYGPFPLERWKNTIKSLAKQL